MEKFVHPIFQDTPPNDSKLWRYLSFAKLASLLQSASLHFTRIDQFDDHFEGAWPKSDLEFLRALKGFDIPSFTTNLKLGVAASCWVELAHESAAMWRLYAPGSEGVAISTTFGKLHYLVESAERQMEGLLAGAGRVKYLDHINHGLINVGSNVPLPNTLSPFMLKNISYEHEREVRALLVGFFSGLAVPVDGLDLPLVPAEFVDEVVVNPFCQHWFFDAVFGLLERYELNEKVRKSTLAREEFYMKQSD